MRIAEPLPVMVIPCLWLRPAQSSRDLVIYRCVAQLPRLPGLTSHAPAGPPSPLTCQAVDTESVWPPNSTPGKLPSQRGIRQTQETTLPSAGRGAGGTKASATMFASMSPGAVASDKGTFSNSGTSQTPTSTGLSLLTSPTTTRSFSSTNTFSPSSLIHASSLEASPTIPEAVTPVCARGASARFPASALRGRFNFTRNPSELQTPTAKKISFDLSGAADGGGGRLQGDWQKWGGDSAAPVGDDAEDDAWLSDALLAAEYLATPRTPSGSRGVTCQLAEDGFKTATKQHSRKAAAPQAWMAGRDDWGEGREVAATPGASAAGTPKTPMSAVAFRRRRHLLVQSIVDEFNATVFEGSLPPDLEIVWSNFFSKTAGMTKFRMLQPLEAERFGGEAAQRQAGAAGAAGAAGRGKGRGGRQEAGLEETDILTASVELSSKVVDNAERLRCTLVHELCHVAQWVVNREAKPPHGNAFRHWAERVEAYDPSLRVTTCHSYDIKYKFMYKCHSCGHQYGRHTRSINVETQSCGECHGQLGMLETPKTKARQPKAFAAFIQHHFHAAKQALMTPLARDPPHSQVLTVRWEGGSEEGGSEEGGSEEGGSEEGGTKGRRAPFTAVSDMYVAALMQRMAKMARAQASVCDSLTRVAPGHELALSDVEDAQAQCAKRRPGRGKRHRHRSSCR